MSAASKSKAFTLPELLVVVGCLAILAMLLLPALARPHHHHGLYCTNNLKQIGLAFKTWALDNNDHYPMQVSVTNGGTMELVNRGNVFVHFLVMSNELSTPKILFCPQERDSAKREANTFAVNGQTPLPNQVPLRDKSLSYFVGVDADDSRPSMFLCGDRQLSLNGVPLTNGLYPVGTNAVLAWYKGNHNKVGNLCLADGSVQQIGNRQLQALARDNTNTYRLAIP